MSASNHSPFMFTLTGFLISWVFSLKLRLLNHIFHLKNIFLKLTSEGLLI
jgi:hypothetical protein